MRRLCAQLICCLAVASSYTVAAAGTPGYIATPDSCCVVDRVVEDTVHLRKVGVCAGKPGRAYIETKLKRVKVVVEGTLWKETDVEGLTVPDLANSLSNADRLAKQMTVPGNRHEKEMTDLAGTLDSYYHSEEFQLRVLNETERIKSEVFGDKVAGYYTDKGKQAPKGKLLSSERVYVFISSAMPLATIRNYAASVARLGDPNVSLVMRGFVDGVSKIQPTIGFIASVLQRDQACRPQDGDCEMLPAGLVVDPLLFRRYRIDRVPAVVYARGLKAEDAGLSEGDPKNTTISDHYAAYGDARLEYLLDQIRRESGSDSLAALLAAPGDRK
ncbi:conjugal transfer protein TrbC [Geobacter sulfurreducens]|nr:conjugal transfer protein TrbC [Geobacter sulfurreducens]